MRSQQRCAALSTSIGASFWLFVVAVPYIFGLVAPRVRPHIPMIYGLLVLATGASGLFPGFVRGRYPGICS